ncbi:MAG: S8 family serine peptidase, partial [Burkholderiaceae bacterium]
MKSVKHVNSMKAISKTAIAVAVAAAILPVSGALAAAWQDPGRISNKASWETAEYEKDWGLRAMNASSAYALGFHGQGAKVGVMDSGALLYLHPELNGDRFHAVRATGEYGSDGMRYPQGGGNANWPWGVYGEYKKGDKFDVNGEWIKDVNDSHGTHVTGSVGGNRDGGGFHGVAWGSDIYVGNTGATDNNNYGPFQDYNFFYAGWKAMVNAGVQVINNSWGTNTRIVNTGSKGPDGGSTGVHLPADTIADTEYEYFYHNKIYGTDKSFVNAAWDAVKGTGVVQIFTTGNRDFANPFYRPLFPYFNPEAEQNWIAVAGLQRNAVKDANGIATGEYTYSLVKTWNEAGNAKWWTVVAPGSGIEGSKVDSNGNPTYGSSSGTSMSAPHVAGAMGVLLSRYGDMTGTQARDVMFTTANNKNADGTFLLDWTAADGTPDVRYGWGIPDLDKGMFGPGQFLGHFDYNMATTPLDVWTNAITQTALDAREIEDKTWLADYKLWLGDKKVHGEVGGDFNLGEDFVVNDGNSDTTDHIISQADADKWRAEYYAKRAAAIQAKIDGNLYDGSLTKRGAGELVMTGKNTYAGGTKVEGGSLYGFTESFGAGKVEVNGGKFGVINTYNDTLTQKGMLNTTSTATKGQKVNVDIN